MNKARLYASIFAGSLLLASAVPANATLTLTAAGVGDGFSLSTFVSGYPPATYGPLSVGVLPDGNLITGSYANAALYTFTDADGQTLGSALSKIPYTYQTGNPQYIFATVNGQVYGAQVAGGTIGQFSNTGAFTPIPNLASAGVKAFYGMWADPANNDLIASSSKGLIEINPTTGTYRVINASVFPDGVTVSPNGATVYAEVGGAISAYSVSTGTLLKTYATGHSPDGTGVISGGSFNGDLIVNDNDGTVLLLDTATSNITTIASGGSRGDFVSPDTNNGTLFLSQQESILRLACAPDCSIGSTSGTPEPGTLTLLAAGFGALALLTRKALA
jgi:hypothetical protein